MSFSLLLCAQMTVAQKGEGKKAKTATFTGAVTRSDTKQSVSGVKILLMDEKRSDKQDNSVETVTGEDGKFSFDELKAGKYTISIRASFDNEKDVPCQLLMGKIDEPNSQLLILTEGDKKIEQIFIKGFSVKAGKTIHKEFDLVCKSLFGG